MVLFYWSNVDGGRSSYWSCSMRTFSLLPFPFPFPLSKFLTDMLRDDEKQSFIINGNLVPETTHKFLMKYSQLLLTYIRSLLALMQLYTVVDSNIDESIVIHEFCSSLALHFAPRIVQRTYIKEQSFHLEFVSFQIRNNTLIR